ncbi:cytochrome c [Oricola sp.]|uniref:cytochrome c n=1 Tax=Oricola sp. TaxID=1979950 RepID=UPI0035123800
MARNIIVAVTAIAVAAILIWRFALQPEPREMASAGAALVEVKVPELSAEASSGEALFNANCASCHGTNAAGQDGVAPPLVHIIYEPNHHGDAAFHMAAQRGVRAHHWPFGDMPPVKGVGGDDIDKIVTYVRALQRANGIH